MRLLACSVIALMIASSSSNGDTCISSDERKMANIAYNYCTTEAVRQLTLLWNEWKLNRCDNIPQPSNCMHPLHEYDKDQQICLQRLKSCYYIVENSTK